MIRSHNDLSMGIEAVPVEVDSNVDLYEEGLCDFLVSSGYDTNV
jgi:hypothetical protein